jgi:hypothetical protein
VVVAIAIGLKYMNDAYVKRIFIAVSAERGGVMSNVTSIMTSFVMGETFFALKKVMNLKKQ